MRLLPGFAAAIVMITSLGSCEASSRRVWSDGTLAYLVTCKLPGVQVMCVSYSTNDMKLGDVAPPHELRDTPELPHAGSAAIRM